jgi:hypothetical protein
MDVLNDKRFLLVQKLRNLEYAENPVTKESPLFGLFEARIEVSKKYNRISPMTEEIGTQLEMYLEHVETLIKKHLQL